MKFEQFSQQPQQLDEVRMGMSDLDLFIESPEAEGIKAGFEAELCFTGLGGGETDYDNPEENYDDDVRPDDIDEICEFFHDGDYNSSRDVRDLREAMQESFYEWIGEKLSEEWDNVREEKVREYIEENDYERDDEMVTYLEDLDLDDDQKDAVLAADPTNKEAYALYMEAVDYAENQLNELVEQALDEQNRSYDYAREEWEETARDDYSERDWLRDTGVRYMSDVPSEFGGHVSWPYYTYPESESGYSEHQAEKLADDLANTLNVETYASGGYHGAKRTATRWIIEPDSSLDADSGDMPAEIISPPMPLKECIQKIQEFFMWADSNEAYTNNSTGFHVGVSLPHVDGRIDYVKLALFLGDKHVLEKFGREGNYYCKSAFDKIKDTSHSDRIPQAFDLMRSGLIELATKTLKQNGHGKYTSINLKNDYVEFRSMGDEYHTKVAEILNTVKRYAYAMYIASRPDMYREEYAKKLYKLLASNSDADGVALFSQYTSGTLTKVELKQQLKSRQANRTSSKDNAEKVGTEGWQIVNRSNNTVVSEFLAPNREHAIQKFHDFIQRGDHNRLNYILRKSGEEQGSIPDSDQGSIPPATQARGGFTGYWKVIIDRTGEEVYRFNGVGNSQADANRVAAQWVRNSGLDDPVSVFPVMGNQ